MSAGPFKQIKLTISKKKKKKKKKKRKEINRSPIHIEIKYKFRNKHKLSPLFEEKYFLLIMIFGKISFQIMFF